MGITRAAGAGRRAAPAHIWPGEEVTQTFDPSFIVVRPALRISLDLQCLGLTGEGGLRAAGACWAFEPKSQR